MRAFHLSWFAFFLQIHDVRTQLRRHCERDDGRLGWLFIVIFCEGLALMLFSRMSVLTLALPVLVLFSIFVKMAQGATFSVVPFINKRALGSVAGIVGAGGNAGAVAAGFLFKGDLPWNTAFLILGTVVTGASFMAFCVRFTSDAATEAERDVEKALAGRREELVAAR